LSGKIKQEKAHGETAEERTTKKGPVKGPGVTAGARHW
jgi:hypothetical protein